MLARIQSVRFEMAWNENPLQLQAAIWLDIITSRDAESTSGEIKVSTSTVAALFSKMVLTGQRIAMVDMVLLVFPAFPYLP